MNAAQYSGLCQLARGCTVTGVTLFHFPRWNLHNVSTVFREKFILNCSQRTLRRMNARVQASVHSQLNRKRRPFPDFLKLELLHCIFFPGMKLADERGHVVRGERGTKSVDDRS